jgi:S-adenosylmethionine/arginine decarboxylase-like enzyme
MKGFDLMDLTNVSLWKCIAQDLTEYVSLTPDMDTFVAKVFSTETLNPSGITFSLILSESHFCGHSWGEDGYMRLELSSCKPVYVASIYSYLSRLFPLVEIDIRPIAW